MIFNTYETLLLASIVLMLGYAIVKRVAVLGKYNIPEPVVGGFIVALLLTLSHNLFDISFNFDTDLQRTMMLVFFASVGLSANFSRLINGGKPLIIFLILASVFIVLQNTAGVLSALLLKIDPAYGLIAGSLTLTGGHGTGIAWGEMLSERFGIHGTSELAMACATFGLVFGGMLGGPIASYLLKRNNQQAIKIDNEVDDIEVAFEKPDYRRHINTRSIIETVVMLSACLFFGQYLDLLTQKTAFQLPTFVWCLFVGVIIRNVLNYLFKFEVAEETIDVLGTVGLSLFLAIALMSLKLWELAGLAIPVLCILLVQVVLIVLFSIFVTYKIMGKDYDAIVMSAGHCGFGLGATPTAVANMQAVTTHYGPSHKAFLIVPMVGAFFIDITNTIVIKVFVELISFL